MEQHNDEKRIHTSQLLKELFKADSLRQYLQKHKDDKDPVPLHIYLQELCRAQGKLPADIIRKADLETSYGYQIFKGTRNPSRDTVLQLAFGFQATLNQAQSLLRYANMSTLYPRIKRDAVVIYCLQHKFALWDTQSILQELDLPMIGERKNG